ncbi:hypothetical protein D3C78_926280 [compost metagenome]
MLGQAHLVLPGELASRQATDLRLAAQAGRRGELILGAHIGQRAMQGAIQEVVDHAAVAETHLVLGRVHVDVDHRRIDLEKQHEGRMAAVVQHVAIGLAHRVGDQLVAHHAAVDIEVLQVGLAAREGRQADPAPQAQAAALDVDGQRLLEERRAADAGHPPRTAGLVGRRMQGQHALAVVAQVEADLEVGQRQTLDHFLQVVELGLLGAQELAPRRGIEEQVTHFHRGAVGMRRRLHPRLHVTPLGLDLPGLRRTAAARGQGQSGHRADRGQRLAAKAQAQHPLEILQLADLAGGMAGQRQRQVVRLDAGAVVAHAQQLDAALLDLDVDARGACIEAVLEQLLGHRGRPLDHLAGSDLVGQPRRQQLDPRRLTHGCTARLGAGMVSI